MGTNVSTTYIQCPADPKKTLGIKLPFLVMIIKNVSAIVLFANCIISSLYCSSENTSHSKWWYWTTRMWDAASVPLTTRYDSPVSLTMSLCLIPLLIVNYSCEAIHLHNAYASGWRLEPNPVQSLWFHETCVRYQLHWDLASADPRQLQNPTHIFLWSPLFRGGTSPRV